MKLVALLLTLAFATPSFAELKGTPFMPEVDRRFDAVEAVKTVRVVYDVSKQGGAIGAISLPAALPAHAIIIRSWFEIKVQFVDAGAGTVALSCEDANNIKTATDITGSAVGALVEGASTGAASAFTTSIAAPCVITATVAGAAQTAGALTLWVSYVVGE
jgi:hypothetical protein